MKLERYLQRGEPKYSFEVEVKDGVVCTVDLFRQLDKMISKSLSEKDKADYSFSMIKTIIDSLVDVSVKHAKDQGIKTIGLSGGVTYNVPITKMVERHVRKSGLKLVVHNKVPNGDGGIAIGQNAIIGNKLKN
jgi:hydrogenase maturation protein HypF